MPVPKSLLHKANARKAKVDKTASNRVLLEQCCRNNGLEELTFRRYHLVSKDGKQTEIRPKQVLGNMRNGIMLVRVEEQISIDEPYDLTSIKENTRTVKFTKDWANFKSKVNKFWQMTLVETEYFDLLVDSTSMVIEKPFVYQFADYYLVFGKMDRKKSVGKRLNQAYGTDEALTEQLEDAQTISGADLDDVPALEPVN